MKMFRFNKPRSAYLSIFGGFLVQLTLGSVYTYSNMAPYLLKYMQNYTDSPSKVTIGNSVWINGLTEFGFGASMSFGGFLQEKLGTSLTILIGGWMMCFGVLLTFWTITVHLALVAISYGLIVGLGVGIAYGVVLNIPIMWFPNSRGVVTGFVLAGFSVGAIALNFLQTYYINENNSLVKISKNNMEFSFIFMSAIYASTQLVGIIMIRIPKISKTEEKNIILFNDSILNIPPHQLPFERDFWVLWIAFALISVSAIMILSLSKLFGSQFIHNDSTLTLISSMGLLSKGFGGLFIGYVNDLISYKKLMIFLSFFMGIMLGTFHLCFTLSESNALIMYIIWMIVLHLLLSGNFIIFPAICARTFGTHYFTSNYGMLFTAYSFAALLTSTITTTTVDLHKKFFVSFMIGSGLSIFAGFVTLLFIGKPRGFRTV